MNNDSSCEIALRTLNTSCPPMACTIARPFVPTIHENVREQARREVQVVGSGTFEKSSVDADAVNVAELSWRDP
jgi:hypothetical protein